MSEHTPGPWLYREPQDDELHEIYSESSGDLICYPVWTHNQRANIPLIAAAPELLAACKQLHNCLSDWMEIADSDDLRDSDSEAIELSFAAIAKAEGRSE
jgi:hypothetical protein